MADEHMPEIDPQDLARLRAAADAVGPTVEVLRKKAIASAPAIDSVRHAMERMHDQIELLKEKTIAAVQTPPDAAISLHALRPTESYILDAQRDTIEAIDGMAELLQQSIEVQRKQTEQLDALRESATKQARFNRWMLRVNVAIAVIACIAISVSVVMGIL